MALAFPKLWPTNGVLASGCSKRHNRTTRYFHPHLASASDRNISDAWDIDLDEWGKNICKTFYFLSFVAVIPFLCCVLVFCILYKSGFGNVGVQVFCILSNFLKHHHQIYYILNPRCSDRSDIELRRAVFYLAHGILDIAEGFASYFYDCFFLHGTNIYS